jgi:hypothetical protein
VIAMPRSGNFTEVEEEVTVSLQAFRDGKSRLGAAVNIIPLVLSRFGAASSAGLGQLALKGHVAFASQC